MVIDWSFEITFLAVFTAIFILCAWIGAQMKKKRVKCQCGYEYEGRTLPHKCPQCGKTLHETEHKNES